LLRRITAPIVDAIDPGEIVWDSEVKVFGCRRPIVQTPKSAALVDDWTARIALKAIPL
jgi:hypothetical protein